MFKNTFQYYWNMGNWDISHFTTILKRILFIADRPFTLLYILSIIYDVIKLLIHMLINTKRLV